MVPTTIYIWFKCLQRISPCRKVNSVRKAYLKFMKFSSEKKPRNCHHLDRLRCRTSISWRGFVFGGCFLGRFLVRKSATLLKKHQRHHNQLWCITPKVRLQISPCINEVTIGICLYEMWVSNVVSSVNSWRFRVPVPCTEHRLFRQVEPWMAVNWEVWEGIAKMENAPVISTSMGYSGNLEKIRKNLQSLDMLTGIFCPKFGSDWRVDMSLEFRFLKQWSSLVANWC